MGLEGEKLARSEVGIWVRLVCPEIHERVSVSSPHQSCELGALEEVTREDDVPAQICVASLTAANHSEEIHRFKIVI